MTERFNTGIPTLILLGLVTLAGCGAKTELKPIENANMPTITSNGNEGFYTVVCASGDTQCSFIKETVEKTSIKDNVYYLDMQQYVDMINEPEITEEARDSRISDMQYVLFNSGASTTSSIVYKDVDGTQYEYKAIHDQEYYDNINDEEIVKQNTEKMEKEIVSFLKNPKGAVVPSESN